MRRFSWLSAFGIFFISTAAHAQEQPLCIPGTSVCWGQANGSLNGGAHGQVGPNGANGGANGNANGNANGGGRVQPAPPYPPPQYPPPQTPPPQPQPPPYTPPTPPPPNPYPPPPAAPAPYTPTGPYVQTNPLGLGAMLAMRVGKSSGFHFGGDLAIAVHGMHWGFELETLFFRGGTEPITDLSFAPSMTYRFGADDSMALFTGFYARAGLEARFSWADDTPSDQARDGQVFQGAVQIGGGYETQLNRDFSWRIFDLRAIAAARTDSVAPDDDHFGNRSELSLMLMSGILFDASL